MNWKGKIAEGVNLGLGRLAGLAIVSNGEDLHEVLRLRYHRRRALTVKDPSSAGEGGALVE
jgi:hypothetical protein